MKGILNEFCNCQIVTSFKENSLLTPVSEWYNGKIIELLVNAANALSFWQRRHLQFSDILIKVKPWAWHPITLLKSKGRSSRRFALEFFYLQYHLWSIDIYAFNKIYFKFVPLSKQFFYIIIIIIIYPDGSDNVACVVIINMVYPYSGRFI